MVLSIGSTVLEPRSVVNRYHGVSRFEELSHEQTFRHCFTIPHVANHLSPETEFDDDGARISAAFMSCLSTLWCAHFHDYFQG